MGNHFSSIYIYMYVCHVPKCAGGITWPKHVHAQIQFWVVKTECYSFRLHARADLAWTKKKRSLRNEKLKANRASETEEQRKERLRIRRENKKTENHEKQILATLKILKRGDNNELERNLRLEKVVASKQLRLGNNATTKQLRLAMEMEEERKARLEKMVATAQPMLALIKGVVDVGAVLSLKPILKCWQQCLSVKLEVLTR